MTKKNEAKYARLQPGGKEQAMKAKYDVNNDNAAKAMAYIPVKSGQYLISNVNDEMANQMYISINV